VHEVLELVTEASTKRSGASSRQVEIVHVPVWTRSVVRNEVHHVHAGHDSGRGLRPLAKQRRELLSAQRGRALCHGGWRQGHCPYTLGMARLVQPDDIGQNCLRVHAHSEIVGASHDNHEVRLPIQEHVKALPDLPRAIGDSWVPTLGHHLPCGQTAQAIHQNRDIAPRCAHLSTHRSTVRLETPSARMETCGDAVTKTKDLETVAAVQRLGVS